MSLRVAVIGGAGYVGTEVCRELQRRGHEVFAVARPSGRLLLERFGISVVLPADVDSSLRPNAIINLAYPAMHDPEKVPALNRDILGTIRRLAVESSRVIHTSTLAVFGFGLDYPVVAGPIRRRGDYVYVESKIDLECSLHEWWGRRDLQIVRLGNVWGPGSPFWTAALADRLTFGEPVGIDGEDGFCNATDVRNVAAYLAFLAEQPHTLPARYHHLAEFSALRWSHWVAKLSAFLGFPPVMVKRRGRYPGSLREEIAEIGRRYSPFVLSQQLRAGRFTGSLRRSAPARLANAIVRRFTRRGGGVPPWFPTDQHVDPLFLEVLSARCRFESNTVEGWEPPFDSANSWDVSARWLTQAGYL